MRRSVIATPALLGLILLSGCNGALTGQVLTNLQGCARQYDGVVSAGLGAGFSGSVKIDCPATPVKPDAAEAEETTAD